MNLCLWNECKLAFDDIEELHNHIIVDHIGRKSKRNLCLECHWRGCSIGFHKRDHIISHIKIHIPYKPFSCRICKRGFKRTQDLKKHEVRRHHNGLKCDSIEKSDDSIFNTSEIFKSPKMQLLDKTSSDLYPIRLYSLSFILN